jgi:hypothetical protein
MQLTKDLNFPADVEFRIHNQDHWDSIVKEWRKLPGEVQDTLQNAINRLGELGRTTGVDIYYDFAPLSFGFSACGFVGGCIFHGHHDNGGDGGAPTFSVNLTPILGWSIHT